MSTPPETKPSLNFIEQIVEHHNETGRFGGRVHTRFPPEPNGFLHIGHAKSIVLNFGLAHEYGGKTNLRFDDTNPLTEKVDYVQAIEEDVRWLGYDWEGRKFFASDYFEQLYAYAQQLIRAGHAYVCDLTFDEIAARRGTPTEPGEPSPYRERTPDESLALLEQMRRGAFDDGAKTLRAKIDMASPNMHLRDPILYRIRHVPHHRTGEAWHIYPTYDFAHGLSDSLEGITHSVCTLEFEVHRPLYDWIIKALGVFHPQQIEFARLNLSYTIMSKRKLLELVESGLVNGWDDPRLPTLRGLRRRGYTPEAIRNFAERVGVAKRDNVIDVALLEFSIREDLNKRAARRLAVLDPIRVVLTNYPEGRTEEVAATNNPEDPDGGTRPVPFGRELWIERDDFMEEPPRKFFRLAPGREVRLKYAYIIRCDEVVKDAAGHVRELHCTYDPASRSGQDTSGKKVKGTLHWLSAAHAHPAEVRLYDRLFTVEAPGADRDRDWKAFLNPDSLRVIEAQVEPSLQDLTPGTTVQFERKGYFCADPDATPGRPVFNRTVTLRDDWTKQQQK
ncbi:MAG: glutamine--tRNA ligase/YqeY domain fusion protein [Catalinimonas sp.]